jgi:hypothetical protein
MNQVTEAKQIFQHVQSAINETIENEMMSLSIKQLIEFIMEYQAMEYKPSAIYTQMAEAAEEELAFREARLHRERLAEAKVGA